MEPGEIESGEFRMMSKRALENALAIEIAQTEVLPIMGTRPDADNAEEVYRICLEQCGVDLAGIEPSAYRAMVRLLGPNGEFKSSPGTAMDSAHSIAFATRFPNAARIRNV
jgi:hypothetical protein